MGYLVSDEPPGGEILVAGKNVSQHGYYKLSKETSEAFVRHSDGKIWFHTGDIGVMDPDGVLRSSFASVSQKCEPCRTFPMLGRSVADSQLPSDDGRIVDRKKDLVKLQV